MYRFGRKERSILESDFFAFSLWATSTKTTIRTEQLIYPLASLVAEFGGTLGLFLGLSFITLWDYMFYIGKVCKLASKIYWLFKAKQGKAIQQDISLKCRPQKLHFYTSYMCQYIIKKYVHFGDSALIFACGGYLSWEANQCTCLGPSGNFRKAYSCFFALKVMKYQRRKSKKYRVILNQEL